MALSRSSGILRQAERVGQGIVDAVGLRDWHVAEVGELLALEIAVVPVAVDNAGRATRDDQIGGIAPTYRQIVRVGKADHATERDQRLGDARVVNGVTPVHRPL